MVKNSLYQVILECAIGQKTFYLLLCNKPQRFGTQTVPLHMNIRPNADYKKGIETNYNHMAVSCVITEYKKLVCK
jgi:hypothetical protein